MDDQTIRDWVQIPRQQYEELYQRIEMLSDIALSAVALKINIEHGFTPILDALDRDLIAFTTRFGVPLVPR